MVNTLDRWRGARIRGPNMWLRPIINL